MENFNGAMIDLAANRLNAISASPRFIPEMAQECRAFRRQSKRDRNHRASTICTTKLFFCAVAEGADLGSGTVAWGVDPGSPLAIDSVAARNSCPGSGATSTLTVNRYRSCTTFVAKPPNREELLTTVSATASVFPFAA